MPFEVKRLRFASAIRHRLEERATAASAAQRAICATDWLHGGLWTGEGPVAA